MKTKHTKKQIQEAINYWKKQLRAGNYKRLNEEISDWREREYLKMQDDWARKEMMIDEVSRHLKLMPKTSAQQEAYDRVNSLAVAIAEDSRSGTALADDIMSCSALADFIGEPFVSKNKREDPKFIAKCVLDMILSCPAQTEEEYEKWLDEMT